MSAEENHPHHTAHEMLQDPEFQALAKRKDGISLVLTLITMFVYFGFILALAFAPDALSGRVAGGATLGIPLGIGVIIICWLLTGIYVRWANTEYDQRVARVKERL